MIPIHKPSTPSMKTDATGHGEPLVLVPGGLTGWVSWRPHAELLAKDRRVVRVQLLAVELGQEAEPLPEGYSVATESGALLGAMDELQIEEADFVAWSYGAEATLDFALDHPARVRSLTLIEPPAFWLLRSRNRFSEEAAAFQKTMQSFGPADVTEAQLEEFLHAAGMVPRGIDPKGLPQWPVWVQFRQSLRTADVPFRHDDDVERVRHFRKPVLLFKGEGSPDYLRGIIDVLGKAFPNALVEELPGGHALHLVSMDAFMAKLTEFLATVPR